MFRRHWLKIFLLLILVSRVFALDISKSFTSGIFQLMQFYDSKTGLWQDNNCIKGGSCRANDTNGFWYWANTERLIADYQLLTGDTTNESSMYKTMQLNSDDILHGSTRRSGGVQCKDCTPRVSQSSTLMPPRINLSPGCTSCWPDGSAPRVWSWAAPRSMMSSCVFMSRSFSALRPR